MRAIGLYMTKNILILIAFVLVASTSNWVPIFTDTTLTGYGYEDSPLKVDTSIVATKYYTDAMDVAGAASYVIKNGSSGGQTVIGGTGTTDDLVLKTTSGVGASGADMLFQVGNNGATEAMRILNSGYVGFGQTAPITNFVVNSDPVMGGINELVEPFTNYYSGQTTGYLQLGTGTATNNINGNYGDLLFVHNLTAVTGDKVAGGFKFLNKSTGAAEKRIGQFFCWAEGAVNKGAMSFYTNDGSGTLGERLRVSNDGKIGIGVYSSLGGKLNVLSTTEQLRVAYDATNYYTTTVGSTAGVTFNANGTGARFTFSDRINIPTHTPSSSSDTGTAGDIAWDASYLYICTATNTWTRIALAW